MASIVSKVFLGLTLLSTSAPLLAQSFTPDDIVGKWALGNQQIIFGTDGTVESCTSDVPFTLTANGTILTINSITIYNRVTGSGTSNILGNWRDSPNGEDVYYRSDGRYLGVFDGEKVAYLGTFTTDFSTNPPTISSCTYSTKYAVSGTSLIQWSQDTGIQTSVINIAPKNSITFYGSTTQTWTWVP